MKIVVLELGFEDDDDAESFAEQLSSSGGSLLESKIPLEYDFIECRVENA